MSQVNFETLSNEWKTLSDIISVDADTTYYLQNRGVDTMIALESSSEPAANAQGGVMVLPYKTVQYKKGTQDLYLRAFNKSCSVNISSEA